MVSRKSMFIFLVAVGCVSAVALLYFDSQRCRATRTDPSYERVHLNLDTRGKSQSRRSHGKIRLPADISIGLAQTENAGDPATIIVSASSLIPVSSGVITLRVPEIGAEPGSTEVLWSGTPSGYVAETAEYTVDALPVGNYRFIAVFEFTPDREDAERLAFSKSLYLDVRPTIILSSNVSFKHIKRVELRRELEERVVASLRRGFTVTSQKTMSREIAAIEARDPGIIARKIAELRATDPDVARRIMELNQVEAEATETLDAAEDALEERPDIGSERIRTSSAALRGRPAFERAVPIPERFRGQ